MAPELTRLAAKLVEGKYHLLLHLKIESAEEVKLVLVFIKTKGDTIFKLFMDGYVAMNGNSKAT